MSIAETKPYSRRLPVGAEYDPQAGVSFRIWAPKRSQMRAVFEDGLSVELAAEPGGYFSGACPSAKPGALYRFALDGENELYPDPISRFQPAGVHGPSLVVDPFEFAWSDGDWTGITAVGQVLYEMHIGTFTAEGTWAAATLRLAYLKSLGITCVEVMPIAEFSGEFGWGYDGVALFAPTRNFGTPDDFRRFVDQAHSIGMGVILDVVYNHLGPDGNYLKEYSDQYFTSKHANDWGESLNFDDTGAQGVREFYMSNARYWILEYHLDGFRFDATQAILDDSPRHILADISDAARKAAGARSIYLIAENEPQLTRIVRPPDQDGYGFDGLWNDDFHHSAMVALTGRSEAYFTDYLGKPQEFISACKWGFLFQGQFSAWQMKRRGTPSLDLPARSFVNYIQNHDQVANFGHGERAHQLSGLAQFRAMTVLLLLAPQTPLLFQGQEFAASSPFQYFADHNRELSDMVHKGRLKELSQFPSNSHPDMQAVMRPPGNRATFEVCKLNWSQLDRGFHKQIHELHRQVLALRRCDEIFGNQTHPARLDGAAIGPDAFVLRYFGEVSDRLVLINLGADLHQRIMPEPLMAAPMGMKWEIMLSTESPVFGGCGVPTLEPRGMDWRLPGVNFGLPGRCAMVLKPVRLTDQEVAEDSRMEQEREQERQAGLAGH